MGRVWDFFLREEGFKGRPPPNLTEDVLPLENTDLLSLGSTVEKPNPKELAMREQMTPYAQGGGLMGAT